MTGRELADRVRKLREARGLSAIQLADRAQIAHSYIALIEAGQHRLPPRGILARLAKALGISEQRLLEPAA